MIEAINDKFMISFYLKAKLAIYIYYGLYNYNIS